MPHECNFTDCYRCNPKSNQMKRPPATEWPYGGPDLPKKRIVSEDVPVSVMIFVVAYSLALGIGFALGVTYGS